MPLNLAVSPSLPTPLVQFGRRPFSASQLRDKCNLDISWSLESSARSPGPCVKGPGLFVQKPTGDWLARTISTFIHDLHQNTPRYIEPQCVSLGLHVFLLFLPLPGYCLRPVSSGRDSVFLCAFLFLWSRCGLVARSGTVGKSPQLHGASVPTAEDSAAALLGCPTPLSCP